MSDVIAYSYGVLELKPEASPEEIKKAYRDLVKVWHPDRFGNDPALQHKAQEKLKEINAAYERLVNLTAGKASDVGIDRNTHMYRHNCRSSLNHSSTSASRKICWIFAIKVFVLNLGRMDFIITG
jgi:curved DNA-binding protein CbpA